MKLPGGSCPMIVRVSIPRPWSASALQLGVLGHGTLWDHWYGTTIPTFTALKILTPEGSCYAEVGRESERDLTRSGLLAGGSLRGPSWFAGPSCGSDPSRIPIRTASRRGAPRSCARSARM